MIRTALATAVLAAATIGAPNMTTAATTYHITGTGDSILAMAYGVPTPGGVIARPDTWVNVEYGRNAYTTGMRGTAGSTTAKVAMLAVARSEPGGWIIIQDNGLGVSDWAWRTMLEQIVAATPDDRCLLAVLPAYRADVDAELAAETRARAVVMGQVIQQHPCRRFVYMANIIAAHPDDFTDGQHPRTAEAQQAIRTAIGIL